MSWINLKMKTKGRDESKQNRDARCSTGKRLPYESVEIVEANQIAVFTRAQSPWDIVFQRLVGLESDKGGAVRQGEQSRPPHRESAQQAFLQPTGDVLPKSIIQTPALPFSSYTNRSELPMSSWY